MQSRFGEGVAEKIGVEVPQLLVQHVHHHTGTLALFHMGVQQLCQDDRSACVAAQMLLHGCKAKILGAVVFKKCCAVNDRIQLPHVLLCRFKQLPHLNFIAQVSRENARTRSQCRAVTGCLLGFLC